MYVKVGVGMLSIQQQYETWPARSRFYRRHRVETKLLTSAKGRHRRLAWIVFLAGTVFKIWSHVHTHTHTHHNTRVGTWQCNHNGVQETIFLEGNVDSLSITWKVKGAASRALDWSWGPHTQVFTLAGGDSTKIIRWRPSVRKFMFDDDHIVWNAYDTQCKPVLNREPIVYTRKRRTLRYFRDIDPSAWCAPEAYSKIFQRHWLLDITPCDECTY